MVIYIAQDIEVNLPSLFLPLALMPCLRGTREHPERGQDFLARSIDTNPLEIYIVLISCPDFTFSVSSKLQSPIERENIALRGSIAENLGHE